jgi:rod shape determining protein RodA
MLATFESTARAKLRPLQKLRLISWPMILLAGLVAGIGFVMLYSAAGGSFDPWADRQMIRFVVGVLLMIGVAIVDLRVWLRNAYFIYLGALLLLIGVEIAGDIGMGAQRWIDLGIFQLQPSELMKVALVLALARYFHSLEAESVRRICRWCRRCC